MHTTNIFGLTQAGLNQVLTGLGLERYRAEQVFYWLYNRYVEDFAEMDNLPKKVRGELGTHLSILHPRITKEQSSSDGTRKFLLAMEDGTQVECVLIPSESTDAKQRSRLTLCLSTQAGCALGCVFCATGTMKLQRHLTAGEIVGQYLAVRDVAPERITNLVFMGMGEPLHNYDAVMEAVEILTHEKACSVSSQHITISTAGLVPGIERWTREKRKPKLALSLHATTDAQRSALMPINAVHSLARLTTALEEYYRVLRRRVTFEYILFEGFNDGEADARRLVTLTRRIPGKVNLIPFHSIDHVMAADARTLRPASPEAIARFADRLRRDGVTVMVRASSGSDIDAACGQLAIRHRS